MSELAFGNSRVAKCFCSSSKLFDVLERFCFPLTTFSSSTDRSRFGAAQTLTGISRRPRIEWSLKNEL